MFSKVLIAEDFDSISIALVHALEDLSVFEIHYAKYCDDAFLKIRKAIQDEAPYDLLISDLSFKTDHWENKLNSGEELIAAVKKIQPQLKILVFSIEDKSFRVKSLFKDLGIDAFVAKGRNSIPELKKAIQELESNTKIVAPKLFNTLNNNNLIEIENYDIALLKLLSKGLIIDDIAADFKQSGRIPNGNSSIEKRINKLKQYFKANNNVHLIAIAKDLGVI